MSRTVSILDYLAAPQQHPPASMCVLFGDEPFLKQQGRRALTAALLGADAEDTPLGRYEGNDVRWRDVLEELATVSLFGGGSKRVVLVEEADKFVSQNRAELESYVEKPRGKGTLILEVSAWLANTKLYKMVDRDGLQIDCRAPLTARGKDKVPDEDRIKQWMRDWGLARHNVTVEPRAAQLLLDFVGPTFGMLDQDLAKLALYVKPGGKITPDLVKEVVGGWRTKTAWEMIDAAVDGQTAEALLQLDRLLQSDEHPVAVFGQISWSLRRYNAVLRLIEASQRRGQRLPLPDALKQAGFRVWEKDEAAAAERRIKQLGRERAGKIYRWLLELDLALKGSHSHADRARFALERLFLKMGPQKATA